MPTPISLLRSILPAALIAATGAGACLAQNSQPAPYTRPVPVRPNLPGPLSEEVGLRVAPPLTREGTFVVSARGQAVKGRSGRWFFVFDPDSAGRTLPPMVLLPNQHLSAVERLAERSPEGTRMALTGSVTVYQGLNYLLVSAPPLVVRAEEPSPPAPAPTPPTPPTPSPSPSSTAPSTPQASPATPSAGTASSPSAAANPPGAGDEPSIDEIVTRLDKAAGRVAATSPQRAAISIDPGQGVVGVEPSEPGSRALVAPGLLVSRRGRIARASDGAMVFIFDSGVDGGAPAPLVVLPSQNLASIEQIAERSGEAATYTVSGEVMTFRGRNYLMVRSYQVNRTGEQVMPAQ